MLDLSAKVFRTYNASETLQSLLVKREFEEEDDLETKAKFYDHCNRQVAILCNH